MASDQQVTASIVLETVMELQRIGSAQAMQRLEQVEPDLMEYVLENLSQLYHRLLELGGPVKRTRRIFRQIEYLVLGCVESMRKGHFRLWEASVEDTPIAQLDDLSLQLDLTPPPPSPPVRPRSSPDADALPD